MPQPWHVLLAPLPADAVVERKTVASAEQIAAGTAGPIAGWESLSVHWSEAGEGLRHVLITVDGNETVLAASDAILYERTEPREGTTLTIYDHHHIGGRFEGDGSFRGTVWQMRTEQAAGAGGDPRMISSASSAPAEDQIAALRRLAAEVMQRAPASPRTSDSE
jgi:hypothetical protein